MALSTKACTASHDIAKSCCSTVSGTWSESIVACTIPIMDNDTFKHCVGNATGETIACTFDGTAPSTTATAVANNDSIAAASTPTSSAPALRIGRAAALAVAASMLVAVLTGSTV